MAVNVRRALVLVVVLLALLPAVASAQSGVTIHGEILDTSGAVLVGVTVTAENLATQQTTVTVSDARGLYELSGLTPGSYRIQAVAPGFRSEASTVALAPAASRTLNMRLTLAPIAETVRVTRSTSRLSTVPQAATVVGGDAIQFAQRRSSAAEALQDIPGLFAQDRRNYSMSGGVRLSIRAPIPSFGMRGLQILQDGIPLTTADGTTQPTNIDLGSVGRIEVIRGPSSVLYGNSAGGVISYRTELPSSRPFVVQPDVMFGSHGYDRQQVKAHGTVGSVGYLLNATRMQTDGHRDYGAAEIRQANLLVRSDLSDRTTITGIFNAFDMPFGESASTLTRADARRTPTKVRGLAVRQGWGESSTQGQGGLTLEHRFAGGNRLRSTGWAMWRDVWNPIPFRIIDLGRVGAGLRSEYVGSGHLGTAPVTYTAGVDASYQRDERAEFGNDGVAFPGGRARAGAQLLGQLERVFSVGPFAQISLSPRPRWMITAGVRYDYYDFDAADRFLADGNQSGGRTLDAFSPMVGVTYSASSHLNVYGNVATAYETPTTVELSNRPVGEGGFNLDLEPEDLRSVEIGVRGLVDRWRLRYELAGYVSTLDNALVEFQRPDEQTFFRNAGRSSRDGVEVRLDWEPTPALRTRLAYAYQRFRFDRFITDTGDFSGNVEPGTPPHRLYAGLAYRAPFGLRSMVDLRWTDAYPVNNLNSVSNWASTVVDLRFGIDRRLGALDVRPFLGILNVFDDGYSASTVPNAFGSRYFEPAPGRELFVGMTLGMGTE